ncbi:MAG TPA: hypothetical protein VIT42_05040 [Microlunatus sp.]
MRFCARQLGDWRWGVYDGATNGWRAVDLGEAEAQQQAMDLDVDFNQYGQRDSADRREVRPPARVEQATWAEAGELDWWIRERGEWLGRVRDAQGRMLWIKAGDLRRQAEAHPTPQPKVPGKTLLERTASFREPDQGEP